MDKEDIDKILDSRYALTSVRLTLRAFDMREELARRLGVSRGAIMELAIRSFYDIQNGRLVVGTLPAEKPVITEEDLKAIS